ncbi:MAG: hypothetical protein EOP88_23170 [Verrucomicrobiaceae bacterium]|nr:MAG: hypothetical protein EOP88_23170 [Verrucomicrobiaceae bacterium]
MNLLATFKTCALALLLLAPSQVRANELDSVDGPNVRTMKHEDGSRAVFIRSPDSRTLTKKTFSPNGVLTMLTIYRMDANQNPLGCKIRDGQGTEMFKVSYGYHKVTGLLVSELMFDSRVKRINKDTGKEMPVQRIDYLYDAEGKRSAPIVFNLLPGKTFEEVFGVKSSALESNPFNESTPLKKGGR